MLRKIFKHAIFEDLTHYFISNMTQKNLIYLLELRAHLGIAAVPPIGLPENARTDIMILTNVLQKTASVTAID